jgi:hypothetical protein
MTIPKLQVASPVASGILNCGIRCDTISRPKTFVSWRKNKGFSRPFWGWRLPKGQCRRQSLLSPPRTEILERQFMRWFRRITFSSSNQRLVRLVEIFSVYWLFVTTVWGIRFSAFTFPYRPVISLFSNTAVIKYLLVCKKPTPVRGRAATLEPYPTSPHRLYPTDTGSNERLVRLVENFSIYSTSVLRYNVNTSSGYLKSASLSFMGWCSPWVFHSERSHSDFYSRMLAFIKKNAIS